MRVLVSCPKCLFKEFYSLSYSDVMLAILQATCPKCKNSPVVVEKREEDYD